MNKADFKNTVLAPLLNWSHLGVIDNGNGNILIGHVPHVAPKAYFHYLFQPLNGAELNELESELKKPLPTQLKEFYRISNGMRVFSSLITMLGKVRVFARTVENVHREPHSILAPNVYGKPPDIGPGRIIIAGYDWDRSVAMIDGANRVERWSVGVDSALLATWDDFDTWLTSEIKRASEIYDAEGRAIGDGPQKF